MPKNICLKVKQAFFPFKTNMRGFNSCGGEFESCTFLEYDAVWLGIIGSNVSEGTTSIRKLEAVVRSKHWCISTVARDITSHKTSTSV
jgi:hypothetical protein